MTDPAHDPPIDPPTAQAPTDPTGPAADEELLAELADDFSSRLRRGQHATVEEYVQQHPKLAERIRKVMGAIALIEESRPFDSVITSEQPGSVVGRYKLLERIGEGGFGVVFMAEQQYPVRRKVALKIIKPGMDSRQVIARFEAERQALALMEHPNIARVLDAGATESGRPYFVMELVHGVPITQYCDEHRLALRDRLELFVKVCRAVQHAHTKGIIHRDLKPTNVLVTLHDGVPVPKVIDFGVAKATGQQPLTERTLFTHFAQMVGTPLYMSPEQAEMSGLDMDTRSDIYSLGVLLYELLTGTTPFDRDRLRQASHEEVRRIIREEDPPTPSTRVSTQLGDKLAVISARCRTDPKRLGQLLHGELDWIVMKALEKDRTRRYETANALAQDVQRYLADEQVQACPPSAVYRFRKYARRYRVALLTAAVVSSVLVAATVASSWQAIRARAAERATRLIAAELALDKGQLIGETGDANLALLWLARSLKLSPPDAVESQVAIRASLGAWQQQVDSLRLVLPHEEPVTAVAFGPDGKLVTACAGSGNVTVRRWDPLTGQSGDPPLIFSGELAFFSPNTKSLLLVSGVGTVRSHDLITGKSVWEQHANEGVVANTLVFSPDGTSVLIGYAVGPIGSLPQTGSAQLFDAATGNALGPVLDHPRPVHAAAFHPDGKSFVTECGTWGDTTEKVAARFWNLQGREIRQPLEHICMATAVAFSPDGSKLLVGYWDRKALLWDLASPTEPIMLQHEGPVVSASFSPDGKMMLTGAFDGAIRLWDLNGKLLGPALRQGHMVEVATFSPDVRNVLVGSRGRVAKLWNLAAASGQFGLDEARAAATFPLATSSDRRTIVTQDAQHVVVLRDAATNQPVGKPLPLQRALLLGGTSALAGQRVACSSDRRRALTVENDTAAKLWDVPSGTLLAELTPVPQDSMFFTAGFSPDSRMIVTGNLACSALVWDAVTGKLLRTLSHEYAGPVFSLAFSPDGKILATGGGDNVVRFWNPGTGEPLGSPLPHNTAVLTLAFSPDGKTIVTGDVDQNVQLWDVGTRNRLLQLSGHRGSIIDATFSPDGRFVLTGSRDESARLWDAISGKPIGPPLPHRGPVVRVAFSADGETILTVTQDQLTHRWPVPRAMLGTPEQIEFWTQVATGMELEDNGSARILDAAQWKRRRQELEQTDLPLPGTSEAHR